VDLGQGTGNALVPALLLQPLIENAIRHGLNGVRHRGIIAIRSRLDAAFLVLTVTDNGTGLREEPLSRGKVGIGLGATCERLERMYPGQHSFTMRAVPEGGTEVSIRLPLKFGQAREAPADAHAAAAHR
jgi:LytS/YehU family sensor histidine kinase